MIDGVPQSRARFRREVRAMEELRGFWTPVLVEAHTEDDPPWFACEYIDAPSLADVIKTGGPIGVARAWRLGTQLAEALKAIHAAGLVHRDLTPANILIRDDEVRIIDFGITRSVSGTVVTIAGTALGTPGYLAPEQLGNGRVTEASDVYALGAVLVYATTGHAPFTGGDLLDLLRRTADAPPDLDGVPRDLMEVISACLSKDPRDRPTVAEVLASCEARRWDVRSPAVRPELPTWPARVRPEPALRRTRSREVVPAVRRPDNSPEAHRSLYGRRRDELWSLPPEPAVVDARVRLVAPALVALTASVELSVLTNIGVVLSVLVAGVLAALVYLTCRLIDVVRLHALGPDGLYPLVVVGPIGLAYGVSVAYLIHESLPAFVIEWPSWIGWTIAVVVTFFVTVYTMWVVGAEEMLELRIYPARITALCGVAIAACGTLSLFWEPAFPLWGGIWGSFLSVWFVALATGFAFLTMPSLRATPRTLDGAD